MTKLNGALHHVSAKFSAIAIGLLVWWGGPATAEDTVRIGVGVDPSFTTWWVAKDRNFFKRYNINAEITQFSGGPELADSTMAGEMDFGSSGTATWMPRFVRSDALLIVGTMATSTDNFKMAALNSIKSLSDLKGKRLGTVAGSTIDYLWALVAQKLNVPESDLNLIPRRLSTETTSKPFFRGSPGPQSRSRFPARTRSIFSRAAATWATSKASLSSATRDSSRQNRT
jgi:ABC-type nitrate/sulfonate/bicarbonate transport system substrate-binding protein